MHPCQWKKIYKLKILSFVIGVQHCCPSNIIPVILFPLIFFSYALELKDNKLCVSSFPCPLGGGIFSLHPRPSSNKLIPKQPPPLCLFYTQVQCPPADVVVFNFLILFFLAPHWLKRTLGSYLMSARCPFPLSQSRRQKTPGRLVPVRTGLWSGRRPRCRHDRSFRFNMPSSV